MPEARMHRSGTNDWQAVKPYISARLFLAYDLLHAKSLPCHILLLRELLNLYSASLEIFIPTKYSVQSNLSAPLPHKTTDNSIIPNRLQPFYTPPLYPEADCVGLSTIVTVQASGRIMLSNWTTTQELVDQAPLRCVVQPHSMTLVTL